MVYFCGSFGSFYGIVRYNYQWRWLLQVSAFCGFRSYFPHMEYQIYFITQLLNVFFSLFIKDFITGIPDHAC
jgi:hypothetical protein